MIKRLALLSALCLLLLFPLGALASEAADDDGFIEPTRDPNAPEYLTTEPQNLVPEHIVARSFILIESSTGESLMERDPEAQMFPASTTKIMTALITLKAFPDLSETITVSEWARDIPDDASRVPFKAGEVVTVKDALYGLLLKSGNEAARALAEAVAGSEEEFVKMMNEVAAMIGCTHTNFVTVDGYHADLHQTTAKDLALIFSEALKDPTFREIISTYSYALSVTNENPSRMIYNSNLHINPDPENERYYQYSIGGKTGYTSQAGYVLVEAAEKDGIELIAVAMYSNKYARWPDTSRLFEYGFTLYDSKTPEEIYAYEDNPITLQISGFDFNDMLDGEPGLGRLTLELRAVDPSRDVRFIGLKDEISNMMANYSQYTNIRYDVELRAPITKGQVMGTMTFYPMGEEPAVYELVASRSIAQRPDMPPTLEEIEARVAADPSPFPPFGWDWVLPPVLGAGAVIAVLFFGIKFLVRRRKKGKQVPKPKRRTFN